MFSLLFVSFCSFAKRHHHKTLDMRSSAATSLASRTALITLQTVSIYLLYHISTSILRKRKRVATIGKEEDLEIHVKKTDFNKLVLQSALDLLSEPWGLSNNHLASLSAQLRPSPFNGGWRSKVKRRRKSITTPGGDALDVEFVDPIDLPSPAPASVPIIIILHGINGSSTEPYMEQAALQVVQKGWRAVILNYSKIRVFRQKGSILGGFNFMDGGDINFLISHLRKKHDGFLAAVGFSMGGTKLVQYLGRTGIHCNLDAACTVSAPLDFTCQNETVHHAHSFVHRLYHFMITMSLKVWILKNYSELKRHPKLYDAKPLRRSMSGLAWWIQASQVTDFDDAITIRAKGYSNLHDYYNEATSLERLRQDVRVPFLCLTAKNDPLVPSKIIPGKDIAMDNEHIFIVNTPKLGGHIGYWLPGRGCWATRACLDFFDSVKIHTPASNQWKQTSNSKRQFYHQTSLEAARNLQRSSLTHLTNYMQLVAVDSMLDMKSDCTCEEEKDGSHPTQNHKDITIYPINAPMSANDHAR